MEIQQLSNRSGREKKMGLGLSAESLAAALSYTLLASSGKQKLCLAITKLHLRSTGENIPLAMQFEYIADAGMQGMWPKRITILH